MSAPEPAPPLSPKAGDLSAEVERLRAERDELKRQRDEARQARQEDVRRLRAELERRGTSAERERARPPEVPPETARELAALRACLDEAEEKVRSLRKENDSLRDRLQR